MHYMVGTVVRAPIHKVPTTKGPQPLNIGKHTRKNRNRYFEPGVAYTLYNIRPVPETGQVEYTFVTKQGEQLIHVFPSITEAEKVISYSIGEDTPNYDNYYNQ